MKTVYSLLLMAALSLGTLAAHASQDENQFDTNEDVRFDRVDVPVGGTVLETVPAHAKAKQKKIYQNILAVGLSPSEMKNLSVECGELLEIQSGDREIKVSVYRLTGDSSPAHATINLSAAAAAKLQVKAGDHVTVHHLENTSLPYVVEKPDVVDYSTRTSEEGSL